MEMLVLNRSVTKTGEHDVLIQLASSLEISILERQEQDIVQYFRKHLKNSLIQSTKSRVKSRRSLKNSIPVKKSTITWWNKTRR